MPSVIASITAYEGTKSVLAGGKTLLLAAFDQNAPQKYPPGTVMKILVSEDGKTVTSFIRPTQAELDQYDRENGTKTPRYVEKPPAGKNTTAAKKTAPVATTTAPAASRATSKTTAPPAAAPAAKTGTLSDAAFAMFSELATAPPEIWEKLRAEKPDLFVAIIKKIPLPGPMEAEKMLGEGFKTVANEIDASKKLFMDISKAPGPFVERLFQEEGPAMQLLVKKLEDATGFKMMSPDDIDATLGSLPTDKELVAMSTSSDGYWRAKFFLELINQARYRDGTRGKIWGYAVGRAAQIVLHATPPASKTPDQLLEEIYRITKEIILKRNATILREATEEAPA